MDGEGGRFNLDLLATLEQDINTVAHLSLPPGSSMLSRTIPEHVGSQLDDSVQPFKDIYSDRLINIKMAASSAISSENLIRNLNRQEKRWVLYAIMNLSRTFKNDNPTVSVDRCVQNAVQLLSAANRIYSKADIAKVLLILQQGDISPIRNVSYIIYSDHYYLEQNNEGELNSPWVLGLSTNTEYYARLYAWSEIRSKAQTTDTPTETNSWDWSSLINSKHTSSYDIDRLLATAYHHDAYHHNRREFKIDDISDDWEAFNSGFENGSILFHQGILPNFVRSDISELRELVRNGELTDEMAEEFAKELARLKIRVVKNLTDIDEFDVESLEDSLKQMILTPV